MLLETWAIYFKLNRCCEVALLFKVLIFLQNLLFYLCTYEWRRQNYSTCRVNMSVMVTELHPDSTMV